MSCAVTAIPTNCLQPDVERLASAADLYSGLPLIGRHASHRLRNEVRRRNQAQIRLKLARTVRDWKPDVVLALVDGAFPALGDVLMESGCRCKIAWVLDDPFVFEPDRIWTLGVFDLLCVVEDSLAAPLGFAVNRPTTCVPLGADVTVYRPLDCRSVSDKVVFVGKSYHGRCDALARSRLLARVSRWNLEIWGDSDWTSCSSDGITLARFYKGGPTRPVRTNEIYNGAAIALNVQHSQIRIGLSVRTFSIAAAGAFQLVDWRPGLEALFDPGSELVAYRDVDHAVELCARYLADAATRDGIAAAALTRVKAHHTFQKRLDAMLDAVAM